MIECFLFFILLLLIIYLIKEPFEVNEIPVGPDIDYELSSDSVSAGAIPLNYNINDDIIKYTSKEEPEPYDLSNLMGINQSRLNEIKSDINFKPININRKVEVVNVNNYSDNQIVEEEDVVMNLMK